MSTASILNKARGGHVRADDVDPDTTPIGIRGIIAATEKLLAINRGLTEPDERDSMQFKQLMTPDKLMRERVKMDADKVRLNLMRRVARFKNLKPVNAGVFDSYATGLIIGNPLSSPLEEINPMHLVEQARRVTHMGPGGLPSEDAISIDAQMVHPSQFGFVSPSEGPECFDEQTEVYTKDGWIPWPDVKDDAVFACRVNGRLEWHKASRIIRERYTGEMIVGEHDTLRMCVTPNHRVINTRDINYRIDLAHEVYGKAIRIPIRHEPYLGNPSFTHFQVPVVEKTNNNQKDLPTFEIGDWCEFIGWWLSEGSLSRDQVRHSSGGSPYKYGHVKITQCLRANPEENLRICALLNRMGLRHKLEPHIKNYAVGCKQLVEYFKQWDQGAYHKWIPEELFEAPVEARRRLLEALLLGDGRINKKRWCYCTVSSQLAADVERLAISLGHTAFIRLEPDFREHVKTTNYVVSIHRQQNRAINSFSKPHSNGKVYGDYWRKEQYDGMVYCATVPGGLLHVRGRKDTSGFWSGNSGRAGIDVRMAWGTKIGSDGRLYQKFKNPKTGKNHWLSPVDLDGKTLGLPD
jgi:hypothetical protein